MIPSSNQGINPTTTTDRGAVSQLGALAAPAAPIAALAPLKRPVLIRLAGIVKESVVDGPGVRQVLFLQGCPHNCPGCHNPHTHALDGGQLYAIATLVHDIAQRPWLTGVTFSGGEPFLQPAACRQVLRQLRTYPQLAHFTYVAYSGYTLEQLQTLAKNNRDIQGFLNELDILIDGPFILSQRDLNLAFRGSRNQRIIYLKS